MRSSAPYTRAILRGSHRGRGHNSTSTPSAPLSRNTTRLRLHRPPFPQPVDIPSASQTVDIPSASQIADIPFAS